MDKKSEITWFAPEFRYYDKDLVWYWLSIIGAGVLFLAAIWQKNLLFGVFIILAESLIIFWGKEFPKDIRFKLDKKGAHIGDIKTYLYEDLAGFHILEEDGTEELVLKTHSKLHPYVKILLASGMAAEIKDFLKNRLEEIKYEESLSEGIAKIIGF